MSQEKDISETNISTPVETPEDEIKQYTERVYRTAIACILGIIAGTICFLVIGDTSTPEGEARGIIGILVLLAFIVFQKYIFLIFKIDYTKLGAKDWFFQGFMTFSLWFISWTLLLTI